MGFFSFFFSEPGATARCEWLKKKKGSGGSDKKICCRFRSHCMALAVCGPCSSASSSSNKAPKKAKKTGTFIRYKETAKTAASNVQTYLKPLPENHGHAARGKIEPFLTE